MKTDIFCQKVPKNCHFVILMALSGKVLPIWQQILISLIFWYRQMASVLRFWAEITKMGKISQKWPKKAKKGQNDKTPATHVAGPPHWKLTRKSGLQLGSIAKMAIFGQKVPKKYHLVLRLVRYCESDSRFWIFWIFYYNKVVLVSGFLAKIKKNEKIRQK